MRRSARHAEVNDPFSPNGKMRRIYHSLPAGLRGRGTGGPYPIGLEQTGECDAAQPVGGPAKERSPVDIELNLRIVQTSDYSRRDVIMFVFH